LPESNFYRGSHAIIVDYCPRAESQEDRYVLEVLNNQGKAYIESIQNLKQDEFQII
jgi:hypothetical protein